MQVFERETTYRVVATNGTEQIVPKDAGNSDYQTLLEWIAEGGIVEAEIEQPIAIQILETSLGESP